jgi:glycogen debranching enzyme
MPQIKLAGKEKRMPIKAEIVPDLKQNRIFTFTDGRCAYFMGATSSFNPAGHFGWNIAERHMLFDWRISVDSKPLDRAQAKSFMFTPHALRRDFGDGIWETVFIADGENILLSRLGGDFLQAVFEVHTALNVERLVCGGEERRLFVGGKILGLKVFRLPEGALFAAAAGDTPGDVDKLLARAFEKYSDLYAERERRLQNIRGSGELESGEAVVDEALLWSRVSLDSLIMRGETTGIWAGLPWFNNFWGRDTFITLPGAALVNGDFTTARAILLDFSRFQFRDPSSPIYGRIPNIITGGKPYYNTADGTWWFVLAALKYLNYSGDMEFCREVFPAVELAIEGALAKCADGNFFITHGDAETWMDAVGNSIPWSPRGDRAVDIQALWHSALLCGEKMALLLGEENKARRWRLLAGEAAKNFSRHFICEDGLLCDHLNSDGSRDAQLRPNQIFAVSCGAGMELEPFLRADVAARVARGVTEELVLEQGVMSLSPKDKNFHPYHDYPAYPHNDAAYHNGIIWTWLAGPVIEALCLNGQQDLAWRLFSEEARQIMQDGCLGGFSELREACPRPGAKAAIPSGTVNQAWNLAEFQRNFIENFIGWHPFATGRRAVLSPALPRALQSADAFLPFADGGLRFSAQRSGGEITIKLSLENLSREIKIACPDAGQVITLSPSWRNAEFRIMAGVTKKPWHFADASFC